MNLNLYNKTFLISGSSKGIGLKIAESLLNEGANTIITGRSKKLVKKQFNKLYPKYGFKLAYVNGDIKNNLVLKKIRNIVKKRWKKLDGIVANAGSVKQNISSFYSEKDWIKRILGDAVYRSKDNEDKEKIIKCIVLLCNMGKFENTYLIDIIKLVSKSREDYLRLVHLLTDENNTHLNLIKKVEFFINNEFPIK